MLDFMDTVNISASGMTAQRFRLDVIASNIANAETTRTEEGGPYRRRAVLFAEAFQNAVDELNPPDVASLAGVRVARVEADSGPFRMVYDPSHPDADENGYVQMPNVNVLREMVDLINAQRAYEANVSALNTTKAFANAALQIGKGG
ncbi:MAG TPA: flagellar basal body rod protein FlgC [Thermotogota bacterium]|nr:flagellar basal body rod protein FlgC [Thermotogota bacterium]HRW92905.1 flagellar basal body rod protein FlgC [Thermotogota bacterium]